ncbi:hypothetical protein cypCar_00045458, partial [Cyprinus carpio]
MSTSTVKDSRKRVIEQSPIKKKFKDSTITKEDLDGAIANGIKLALKEQQSTLDSVVPSTVRDAIDSVLTTVLRDLHMDILAANNSVKELKAEVEKLAIAAKQTRDRVNSVQAAAREDRRTVMNQRKQLEQLTKKVTNMEDRSRRNNVRLVGLPEGMEGCDAAGFLRDNLSKWIPALKGCDIEIEQAHRVEQTCEDKMIQNKIQLVVFLAGILSKASCDLYRIVLIEDPKTWTEAQSYCREKYTDLAMVQSDEDRAKLKEAANAVNFQSVAWIGFYRFIWGWSYQNTPISYEKWKPLEPDLSNTNEACGFVNQLGKWADRLCTELDYFFCQI